MAKKFLVALIAVFVMAFTVIPTTFASTTYSNYGWSISCSGNGPGSASGSWYWYAGSTAGASLASGVQNCNGTSSTTGVCPTAGVCSLGRPSTATTLVVVINVSCGYSYSKSITQSVTPGAPVSVTVSQTVKHGSCNGTYAKGEESGTITVTA